MDNNTLEKRIQEQRIQARVCWLDQDSRVTEFLFESKVYKTSTLKDYFNNNKCIATANATSKIVETFINNHDSLKLTYEEFKIFIEDKALYQKAIEYREKNNTQEEEQEGKEEKGYCTIM
jgi:ribosomal 50S subunit-recycling heat shock protein